jgi:hypothetical protein
VWTCPSTESVTYDFSCPLSLRSMSATVCTALSLFVSPVAALCTHTEKM